MTHGERLLESATKAKGVARFQWRLPDLDVPHAWLPRDSAPNRDADESLSRRLVVELGDQRVVPRLDGEVTKRLYRRELVRRGLTSVSGRLHLAIAAQDVLEYVIPRRAAHELKALPQRLNESKAQLAGKLREDRGEAPDASPGDD